ncbi:hypothetical protein FKW77_000169 [Venturia effusa]|uniref:BTB domain-containing protein n=1 Tax=Venturia effusa TaxID=50376 RepID=A0A517L2H8_9PEZI|nr:hypothetical protein FKW77_000169 [Venturia effusa]
MDTTGMETSVHAKKESVKRQKPHKNHTAINEHVKAMRQKFESGEDSDVTLRAKDGTVFKLHKVIITGQSRFFKKACHPEHFKEGVENHINLELGDSSILEMLLEYLYVLDYDDRALEPDQGALITNAEIYAAADFYDISSLKTVAQAKMKRCVTTLQMWSNREFPQAISIVYTTTLAKDRGLRDIVLKAALENFKILKKVGDQTKDDSKLVEFLEGRPTLTQVMSDVAEFAADVAFQLSNRWMDFRQVKCECGHTWAYSGERPEQIHMACPHCLDVRTDWSSRRVD